MPWRRLRPGRLPSSESRSRTRALALFRMRRNRRKSLRTNETYLRTKGFALDIPGGTRAPSRVFQRAQSARSTTSGPNENKILVSMQIGPNECESMSTFDLPKRFGHGPGEETLLEHINVYLLTNSLKLPLWVFQALTPFVRIPIGFGFDFVIKVNVFDIPKVIKPFCAQFPVQPTQAHSAEGSRIIVSKRVVDPKRPGPYVFHGVQGILHVVGVDAGPEAVIRIVGELYGFFNALHGHDGGNGPKCFGPHDFHSVIHIGNDRRFIIETLLKVGRNFAAFQQTGSCLKGPFQFDFHFLALGLADHWAQIDVGSQGIADSQGFGEVYKSFNEFLGNTLENINPFG